MTCVASDAPPNNVRGNLIKMQIGVNVRARLLAHDDKFDFAIG